MLKYMFDFTVKYYRNATAVKSCVCFHSCN